MHVHAREGKCFGYIPTFLLHQRPNVREAKSVLPDPAGSSEAIKVEFPKIPQRTCTHVQDDGELEGKGNWKGNWKKDSAGGSKKKPQQGDPSSGHVENTSPTTETWNAFQSAYESRYQVKLPRNAKINGQLSQFVTRIPKADAPAVAAFYVRHNDRRYTGGKHPVGLLLLDAERLWTEWKTNRPTTTTEATQLDKKQARFNAFQTMLNKAEAREAGNGSS